MIRGCAPRRIGPAALAFFAAVLAPATARAQDAPAPLDAAEREAVVLKIQELLAARYVYPEVGQASGDDLVARLEAGEFDDILDAGPFAACLTEALQGVSHDKHLRVRVRPPAHRGVLDLRRDSRREAPRRAAVRPPEQPDVQRSRRVQRE